MKARNQKGMSEMIIVMTLVAISAIIALAFMSLNSLRAGLSRAKQATDFRRIQLETALDTFVQAYRFAEMHYVKQLAGCPTAKPFIVALTEGSGCPTTVKIFNNGASHSDPGRTVLYDYAGGGCKIKETESDCEDMNATDEILTIGVGGGPTADAQKIGGLGYKFYFRKAFPELHYIQFAMTEEGGTSVVTREINFAMKSYFSNTAHLESDGRVTQENPDQLALCPGKPWSNYPVFYQKKCVTFSQYGGGTGLAYYRSRFFGFRPADGLIIDLLEGANVASTTYIVDSATGKIGSEASPVFVPYPDPADPAVSLLNVDDITMIDNQMYFVSGMGGSAQIGYVSAGGTRTRICDLSADGWSQAYVGIAALSWSDPLMDDPSNPLNSFLTDRYATFFLKTDGGDLITAVVNGPGSGPFTCSYFKDQTLQQIEFKRTLGFDRTVDEKPYYIF